MYDQWIKFLEILLLWEMRMPYCPPIMYKNFDSDKKIIHLFTINLKYFTNKNIIYKNCIYVQLARQLHKRK